MGGVTQLRVLGGALWISIGTNLLNSQIKKSLSSILSEQHLTNFLQAPQLVGGLDPELRNRARLAFAEGYNIQIGEILGFVAAEFISIALLWERKPTLMA